jgi:hypothetical protein
VDADGMHGHGIFLEMQRPPSVWMAAFVGQCQSGVTR